MSASSSDPDFDPLPDSGPGGVPERQVADNVHVHDVEGEYGSGNDDLRSKSPPGPSRKAALEAVQPDSPESSNGRTVPDLKDNPYMKDPSYVRRPNRYFGPPSTWLSWTEEDRLTAEGLDRLRSEDLSLHLYNAYYLNVNGTVSKNTTKKRPKGKGSIESEHPNGEEQRKTLVPPRGWTVWPLPPDRVPRDPLLSESGRANSAYRKPEDPRPSAILEECFIANTTRLARERWERRAWQDEFLQKWDWGIKVEQGEEDVDMSEPQDTLHDESIPNDSDAADTFSSEDDSSFGDTGDQYFTSQAYDLVLGSEAGVEDDEKPAHTEEPLQDRQPIPILDDDAARDLLLPSTRHAIGKLDDLLMGLHKARQAYAATPLRRRQERSRSRSRSSSIGTDLESALNVAQTPSRKRKRQTSVVSNVSAASGSTACDDLEREVSSKRKPKPRDWSDVIGMAALTGWDSDIVERASQRCATLFGENMWFRTFHEGDTGKKCPSYFTEFNALDDEEAPQPETNMEASPTMIRSSQACNECHFRKERCEPQEGGEGSDSCKRCLDLKIECSGITIKIYNAIGRTCPFKDCERHDVPFRKSWNLQRHLDSVHQREKRRMPATDTSSPVPSQERNIDIVCPVQKCPRHTHQFSKGTKLYEHLRRMHPEVDVNEFKKLESARRGERRGRYRDESRREEVGRANRSRSKSVVPFREDD